MNSGKDPLIDELVSAISTNQGNDNKHDDDDFTMWDKQFDD